MSRPMRYALLFALVLPLASCDAFGSSTPDVAGTWRGGEATAALLITSRTAQPLPDFTRPAEVGLRVSGAETATLRYLGCRSGSDPGHFVLAEGPIAFACRPEGLGLLVSPLGPQPWTFGLASGQSTYRAESPAPDAVRLTSEGYTIQPTTLRDADTGAEVVVGGAVRFPQIGVPARRPTPVPDPVRTLDLVETEAEFGADGAFRLAGRNGSGGTFQIVGTWRDIGDGLLEVDFGQFVPIGGIGSSEPLVSTATVDVRDGRLAFFLEDGGSPSSPQAVAEAVVRAEGLFHAEAGSFAAVTRGVLYDLQRVSE